MGAYINFQFATLRKKVGPYIIIAIALVVIGALAILTARSTNNNQHATSLGAISTFTKFFPFLFAVLFSALVITHIFKEGESDGSELIVVAKPLTRSQIVMGKFLLSLIYVFAFQVIMFIGYILFTQFDSYATSAQKFKWALSLFLGGLIVQIIASSIIIMLASVLGKVGTVVISILFAAVVPILSFILVPLGKGWRAGSINEGMYQKQSMVNIDATDGKYISEDASSVYEELTDIKDFESKYGNGGWYKGAAFLDIWYHWGRFYSVLMPTDTADTAIVKWEAKQESPKTSLLHTTTQGDWRISLIDRGGEKLSLAERNTMIDSMVKSADLTTLKATIAANKTAFDNAPLLNRMAFIAHSGDISYLTNNNYDYSMFMWDNVISQDPNFTSVAASVILKELNEGDAAKIANVSDLSNLGVLGYLNLVKSDAILTYLKSKDFLPTGAVVGIWSVIGIAMCAASLLIYSRRDFK